MTSILISRFLLNLRAVYTPGSGADSSIHLSRLSDIRFANTIVGNLGAPLGVEEEEESVSSRPPGGDTLIVNISDDPLKEYYPSASIDGTLAVAPKEEKVGISG